MMLVALLAQAQITSFPYTQGFENGLDGWTVADNDGDGDNWFVVDNGGAAGGAVHFSSRTGSYAAASRGYAGSGQHFNPDNFLVSPAMVVGDNFVMELWYYFTNPDQGSDPMLSIYVSTEGNTAADLLAGDSLTTVIGVDETWRKLSVSLSEYAGETVYIGLRHHHSWYQWHFVVDDIVVRSDNAPQVSLSAPMYTGIDSTVTIEATLVAGVDQNLTWTWVSTMAFNGDADMEQSVDTAVTLTYYAMGNDTISVTASNDYGVYTATVVLPVFNLETASLPYVTGFEDGEDASFLTFNSANAWIVGAGAASAGSHAIYISNDGEANTYNPNAPGRSYAVRMLSLADTGAYYISYDWRCNAETGYDFMRVALAPDTQEFDIEENYGVTISALPEGWIALDGGNGLTGQTEWTPAMHTFNISQPGSYWLVLYWYNDQNTGQNPAAAIDNVVVDDLSCPMPKNLTLDSASGSMLGFSWMPGSDETVWAVSVGGGDWDIAVAPSYVATGLTAAMLYTVRVKAVCGDGDSSYTLAADFRTACDTVTPSWREQFEDAAAADCWTFVDGDNIGVIGTTWAVGGHRLRAPGYPAVANDWAITPVLAIPEASDGIALGYDVTGGHSASGYYVTHYYVRVSPTGSADTAAFTDTLLFEAMDGSTHRNLSLDAYAGQNIRIAFIHRAESDGGMSIDNVSLNQTLEPMASIEGPGFGTVGVATTFTGHLLEGVAQGIWFDWSSTMVENGHATAIVDSNSYSVNYNLDGTDTVTLILSNSYGNVTVSKVVAVRDLHPAELPYYTGFESAEDTAWTVANGMGNNAWTIGSATAASGQRSLYVSSNGGTGNVYAVNSASNSVASRALNITQAGDYYVQFSWHCVGEGHNTHYYDFMRVMLAPAAVDLGDADLQQSLRDNYQLPEGFISIDGPLYNQTDTTAYHVVGIDEPGIYQLAFFWTNDNSNGTNPPAAIDSVSFGRVLCPLPQDIALTEVGTTSLSISWADNNDNGVWLLEVDTISEVVYGTEYTLDSLEPATDYTFTLRTICGEGDTSVAVSATFRTECAVVAELPFVEDFENITPAAMDTADVRCWSYFGGGFMTVVHRQGNNRLMPFTNQTHNDQVMVLPEFERNITDLQLSLDALPEGDLGGTLQLGYMTDPSDTSTFVATLTCMHHEFYNDDNSALVYHTRTATFEDAPDGARMAIRHVVNHPNYFWYIDNVEVDTIHPQPEPCDTPVIDSVSAATNSVTAYYSGAASYEVAIVEGEWTEQDSATATSQNVNTFYGLAASTLYTVGVRAVCPDGQMSEWVTLPITTLADSQPGDTTGIDNAGNVDFLLTPNPATTMVKVDGVEPGTAVALLDISGRIVLSAVADGHEVLLDVSRMPRGAYFVRLTGAKNSSVSKLLIQ